MSIYYNKSQIVTRDYEDFVIVYNLKTKKIIILRDVARDIWNYIFSSNETTLGEISRYISDTYDVNEEDVFYDVNTFIEGLLEDNFVETAARESSANKKKNQDIETLESRDIEGEIIELMKSKNQIFSATFELTYLCNEKCIHCYATYPTDECPNRILNLNKCKELIDELYEMNCCQIIFTGGDPFMFEGFPELFKYARSKNFICDIYTNGQAIAEDSILLDEIASLYPKSFYISLYGSTREVHDGITQIPGSFEKTISAIKMLREAGVSVVLNIMMMKPNGHQIGDIIDLASKLNVEYRVGLSIISRNNGDDTPNDYFIDDKSVVKEILTITSEDSSNVFNMDIPIFEELNKSNLSDSICGAGTTALCISPDGEVYPCVSLKKSLGSVFKSSLTEIWNSSSRKSLVSELVWSNTISCKECEYLSECPHCVGISQAENGSLLTCNECDRLIAESVYELNQKI